MFLSMPVADLLLVITTLFFLAVLFSFGMISLKEKEVKAAGIFILAGLLFSGLAIMIGVFGGVGLKWLFVLFPFFLVIVLFLPVGSKSGDGDMIPSGRIDERDVMFSRRLLKEGTQRYETYYSKFPEKKLKDDRFREKPGLLSKNTSYYDPMIFAAADAGFQTVEALATEIDGKASREKVNISGEKLSLFLKNWGKQLGTTSVGITNVKDYHLYSYRGRNHNYNKAVEHEHAFAIAFTVEMDKNNMDTAPKGPTVMESACKYMDAGSIAVQMAWFIRNLGFEARAHIDGNYEVVCPLVARDAGLGEIGRMGLLMTPDLGPRVRIGVVTTNMELKTDKRIPDFSVIDFCERCKKCAVVCPSQSISTSNRQIINGIKRWQINQESCYDFWCSAGTDCGRCVAVCPYSHPDNILHKLVRFGIKHSVLFRMIAAPLDDLFYGKIPKSKPVPEWMKV
jgi:reductive dehalogenase